MSTIQTIKNQIQTLLDIANNTTGKRDTNLTDGVNALVAGFGQGVSSGDSNYQYVSTPVKIDRVRGVVLQPSVYEMPLSDYTFMSQM